MRKLRRVYLEKVQVSVYFIKQCDIFRNTYLYMYVLSYSKFNKIETKIYQKLNHTKTKIKRK